MSHEKSIEDLDNRIDLADPIREICERLSLDINNVAHIDFTPSITAVDIFLTNEHGSKYIVPATGEAAMETLTFKTRS